MDIFESKKTIRDHLVALIKELIRFPSHTQEPLKTFELIEFIKTYFEKDRMNIKSYVFNGIPSVVITFEETKHPNILLSGHIDVVPSSTKYTAEEADDKLYGSGAMDMKSGVACMMAIMKYFARHENPPSLGIMITSDEEVGSANGTIALLDQEGYRSNFVILNEGREKYDIVVREKGLLTLKFTKKGEFIHSAYPWKVENALESLMQNLLKLKRLFPKTVEGWRSTASVTVFHSGKEMNTIPGIAEAIMNIRLTGGKWTREKIMERIKRALPENIEVSEIIYGEIFLGDTKNEQVKLLKSAAEKVMQKKMSYGENHGSSDARIFSSRQIPTVVLGPVGKNHHTPNEYVEIESIVNHFEVLKLFVEEEQKLSQKTQKLIQ